MRIMLYEWVMIMADVLRFGIVGLGMGRARANLIPETPGAELIAVCDVWEERGQKAQDELGCEWIQDYDEMLAREDIDVIGVFTPSGMHAEFSVMALQAGKHCFSTKPMDITVEACDAVIKTADETGLVYAVDFESRYNQVNHQISDAVQSGAIGTIILGDLRIKWFRTQDYYNIGFPEAWRSRLETEGGSLANQAVHYLDLLQWWLGPVESVFGRRGTFTHDIETEDATASMLQFASGAVGMVMTTTCSFPSLGSTIEITGTTGTLTWHDQEITRFTAAKGVEIGVGGRPQYVLPENAPTPEEVELEPQDFNAPDDLPANIIEDMLAAINEGKPPHCDGYEGRKTVELFEAVYESSDTGEPVKIG